MPVCPNKPLQKFSILPKSVFLQALILDQFWRQQTNTPHDDSMKFKSNILKYIYRKHNRNNIDTDSFQ
jgi:hypothetical protein